MDDLAGVVRSRTTIGEGYRVSASPQSMEWYLNDWQAAFERLGQQIEELRTLWARRCAEVELGTWPPTKSEASA